MQITEIAYELLKRLENCYKLNLFERYKITDEEWNEIKDLQNPIYELMKLIARKRGALISGGKEDIEKVSRIILDDFRSGRIGKITLEEV